MTILRESIGRLIGPQGTTIRNIQRMTGEFPLLHVCTEDDHLLLIRQANFHGFLGLSCHPPSRQSSMLNFIVLDEDDRLTEV